MRNTSAPAPPSIASAPAPPVIVSAPLPPVIVSFLSPVVALTPASVKVRSYWRAASKLVSLKVPVTAEKVIATSPTSFHTLSVDWFSSTRPTVARNEAAVPSSTPPAVPTVVSEP